MAMQEGPCSSCRMTGVSIGESLKKIQDLLEGVLDCQETEEELSLDERGAVKRALREVQDVRNKQYS